MQLEKAAAAKPLEKSKSDISLNPYTEEKAKPIVEKEVTLTWADLKKDAERYLKKTEA